MSNDAELLAHAKHKQEEIKQQHEKFVQDEHMLEDRIHKLKREIDDCTSVLKGNITDITRFAELSRKKELWERADSTEEELEKLRTDYESNKLVLTADEQRVLRGAEAFHHLIEPKQKLTRKPSGASIHLMSPAEEKEAWKKVSQKLEDIEKQLQEHKQEKEERKQLKAKLTAELDSTNKLLMECGAFTVDAVRQALDDNEDKSKLLDKAVLLLRKEELLIAIETHEEQDEEIDTAWKEDQIKLDPEEERIYRGRQALELQRKKKKDLMCQNEAVRSQSGTRPPPRTFDRRAAEMRKQCVRTGKAKHALELQLVMEWKNEDEEYVNRRKALKEEVASMRREMEVLDIQHDVESIEQLKRRQVQLQDELDRMEETHKGREQWRIERAMQPDLVMTDDEKAALRGLEAQKAQLQLSTARRASSVGSNGGSDGEISPSTHPNNGHPARKLSNGQGSADVNRETASSRNRRNSVMSVFVGVNDFQPGNVNSATNGSNIKQNKKVGAARLQSLRPQPIGKSSTTGDFALESSGNSPPRSGAMQVTVSLNGTDVQKGSVPFDSPTNNFLQGSATAPAGVFPQINFTQPTPMNRNQTGSKRPSNAQGLNEPKRRSRSSSSLSSRSRSPSPSLENIPSPEKRKIVHDCKTTKNTRTRSKSKIVLSQTPSDDLAGTLLSNNDEDEDVRSQSFSSCSSKGSLLGDDSNSKIKREELKSSETNDATTHHKSSKRMDVPKKFAPHPPTMPLHLPYPSNRLSPTPTSPAVSTPGSVGSHSDDEFPTQASPVYLNSAKSNHGKTSPVALRASKTPPPVSPFPVSPGVKSIACPGLFEFLSSGISSKDFPKSSVHRRKSPSLGSSSSPHVKV